MVTFTPTDDMIGIKVPCIEDARADFAPYYDQRDANDHKIKDAIYHEMAKLGADNVFFREGYFGNSPKRYGYVISFTLGGQAARMDVAGLPMRTVTDKKILRVKLQALCIVRDWLKSAVTAQVFSPGNHPLVQFLLVDGERTLVEALIEDRRIPDTNPMLPSKV